MGKHSEWRKVVKKLRRKRMRQFLAQNRNDEIQIKENSPSYLAYMAAQQEAEEFQAQETAQLAIEEERKYWEREQAAQIEFCKLQKKLEIVREERAKQVARIKEEWENEQKRLKAIQEEKLKVEQASKKKHEDLQNRINNFLENGGELPAELSETLESNPGKTVCPFFKKTASCRFGHACSRNHVRPTVSCVLLFKNFYSHYSLEQKENEHGDVTLEFDQLEIYSHFKDFFWDILNEFKKSGKVVQLKVCCNTGAHLRGNVYVEYENVQDAMRSYRIFHGRWYAGRQINVEFVEVGSWKAAICGLFFVKRCPKGSSCNFLHVFRNPEKMFCTADRDMHRTSVDNVEVASSAGSWRWSESPERVPILSIVNGGNHKSRESRSSRKDDTPRRKGRHQQEERRRRSRSRSKSSHRTSKRKRRKRSRS